MINLDAIKNLDFYDQLTEVDNLASKKPKEFLELINSSFKLESFIPQSFINEYYSNLGKDREYDLPSILYALLIMHILHIPTVSLLCTFLAFSNEISKFCGFHKGIPDESFFSRFKTTFEKEIGNLFNNMVPYIVDTCENINDTIPKDSPYKNLNCRIIYDTSGLKPKVKENNPKTLVSEINRQKSFAKVIKNDKFNPYAAAYKNMPKQAQANPEIKLDFVNGHFGYFYRFGLITNGWGIPLALNFFDEEFYNSLPKEFNTPEEQKYSYDNASLKPVIVPFLQRTYSSTTFRFTSFTADSEFDSYDNFGLLNELKFQKVFIPINPRSSKTSNTNGDLKYNEDGTPLCPVTEIPFKCEGPSGGKNRSRRIKFSCDKCRMGSDHKRYHLCEHPCTTSKSGRMTYVYPDKDFRMYPGVHRGSDEFFTEYKTRTRIEQTIGLLKSSPSLEKPKTVNTATMRADLYLVSIAKLINVVIANAMNDRRYIRTIRPLLKMAV